MVQFSTKSAFDINHVYNNIDRLKKKPTKLALRSFYMKDFLDEDDSESSQDDNIKEPTENDDQKIS